VLVSRASGLAHSALILVDFLPAPLAELIVGPSNLSADPSANFYSVNDFNPALANSYYNDFGPTAGVYGVNNGLDYYGGPFSAGFNTYAGGPDNSYIGGGPGSMGYGGFDLNSLAGSVTGFNGALAGGRGGIGDLGLQGPKAAPAGLLGFLGISPARGAELYDPEAQAPDYGKGFTNDPSMMPSKDPAPWQNLTPQEVPEEPTTTTLQQEMPSKEGVLVAPTEVLSPAPAPTATVPAAPSAQSYASPWCCCSWHISRVCYGDVCFHFGIDKGVRSIPPTPAWG
jgi:hypothetical protein